MTLTHPLNTRRITPPAKDEKDGKAGGGGAGTAATPKQRQPTVSASLSVSAVPSRPSSPSSVVDDSGAPLSGTSVLQAALQKKQGHNSIQNLNFELLLKQLLFWYMIPTGSGIGLTY